MAALGEKITIGIDYRPCMVHIPTKKQSYRKKGDRINVYEKEIEPEHEIKALFHCWSHRSEVVGESPLRGGHPGGQVSGTFAIVEYEDGTVHEVEPQNIRFVDNVMSEYAFPQMEREQFMCICENANNRKIPVGRAGIIETKYGYFMAFHFENRKPEDTAVPIKYCPFCGRKLAK